MSIQFDSTVISEVRAERISALPAIGATLLRFSIAWSMEPKRDHTHRIFGTYARVSVAIEGLEGVTFLGHALPEVAFAAETRVGHSYSSTLLYDLTVHADQMLALEHIRHGRGLVFTFEIRGNSSCESVVRQFNETLHIRANATDWVDVLRAAQVANILLVGVSLPLTPVRPETDAAIQFVRRANEFLLRGEYDSAVGACRQAIESVWTANELQTDAIRVRSAFCSPGDRKSMSKFDRQLLLGEALRHYTHPAHHVTGNGDAAIFSKSDAALAIATAAALVSCFAPVPDNDN